MKLQDYANLTYDERMKRICEILARCIYRYRAEQEQGFEGADKVVNKVANPRIDPAREYSVSEAARKTGVPRRTLQRWIRKGALHVNRAANGLSTLKQRFPNTNQVFNYAVVSLSM